MTKRADFGSRVATHLLDQVLLWLCLAFVALTILGFPKIASRPMPATLATVLVLAVVATYLAMEVLFAASAAKLLLGYRIRSVDGNAAAKPRLLARVAIKNAFLFAWLAPIEARPIAATITMLIVLSGYLLAIGPNRQALHDRIANTSVFRIAAPAPASQD